MITPGAFRAAHGDGHRPARRRPRRRRVMLRQGEPEDPAGSLAHSHRSQVELAFTGSDLGLIAVPLAVQPGRGEVPLDQVRGTPSRPVPGGWWPGRFRPGRQALFCHQRSDGVLAHPPPGVLEVSGDHRGPRLPSQTSNSRLTSAASRARRAARGGNVPALAWPAHL